MTAIARLKHPAAERACRLCGCTEFNACPGSCSWVGPDLCSACVFGDNVLDTGNADRAFAIKVRGRYFSRFGKTGNVLTAWSIAGARLYLVGGAGYEIAEAVRRIRRRAHRAPWSIHLVGIDGDAGAARQAAAA